MEEAKTVDSTGNPDAKQSPTKDGVPDSDPTAIGDSVVIVKDENAKPKVVEDHVAKDQAKEAADQAAKEKSDKEAADKAAKEKADKEAKDKADKEAKDKAAKEKAEQEAKDKAAKEKADQEAKVKAEKEAKEKADKEAKEKADKEAKEKADKEAKEKADQAAKDKLKVETKAKAPDSKGATNVIKEAQSPASALQTPTKKKRPNLEVGINKLRMSEKMDSEEVQSPFRKKKKLMNKLQTSQFSISAKPMQENDTLNE